MALIETRTIVPEAEVTSTAARALLKFFEQDRKGLHRSQFVLPKTDAEHEQFISDLGLEVTQEKTPYEALNGAVEKECLKVNDEFNDLTVFEVTRGAVGKFIVGQQIEVPEHEITLVHYLAGI